MLRAISVDSSAKFEGAELTFDEESPTVRRFVELLEERILEGHSEASNRTWATVELGVPMAKYDQLHAMVLKAWTLAGTPQAVTTELRNVARKRYEYLYKVAVSKGKIKEALHALDAQVKLDGLDQPPEGSLEDKVIGGMITNAARATLSGLMQKARHLAERGVPKAIAALPSPGDRELDEDAPKQGVVIDLREANK